MRSLSLFIIALLSLSTHSSDFLNTETEGNSPSQSFEGWGIGVILAGDSSIVGNEYPPLLPPEADFPVYASPDGPVIGIACVNKRSSDGYEEFLYTPLNATESIKFDYNDSREVYYEQSGLLYFEEEAGFVRIFHHTLKGKPAWIKKANLRACHLKVIPWMEFLLSQKGPMYHPPEEYGLNMRTGPGTSHSVVTTLKGDLYVIELTGNTQGLWAEARVTLYTAHPCEGDEKVVNTYEGWFKLLDDTGYPNIWYYVRGC